MSYELRWSDLKKALSRRGATGPHLVFSTIISNQIHNHEKIGIRHNFFFQHSYVVRAE